MKANKIRELIRVANNLKILYVEDDYHVQEAVLETISQFFDHIDTASNGYEGLEKYKNFYIKTQNYYDIVISDIIMPKMDGITMCKEIFNCYKDQHILITSAYNDSDKLQSLIELGVFNYIQKPIDSNSFIDTLYNISMAVISRHNENIKIQKIKTLNEELDALVDSFDKYVIASRTDLSGKITYASKAYEIISGYKKEELIGKPHNIVRHPDMPKSAFKQMWETIKNEDIWTGEVKNRRKDNSFYWVKATIGPYYDSQNNLIGYSAIREDITDKKAVEQLHEKVNNLLNNAGQGFLSFNKNFIVQDGYSKKCLSILQKDDIEGLNISDLIFSDNKSKKDIFEQGITNIIQTQDSLSKDLFLSLLPTRVDIYSKSIEIEYKILDNNNFMMILTDITQNIALQKKLDNEIQQNKMVVSVASSKSEFLELKSSFKEFLSSVDAKTDLDSLLRELHTFKGLFLQKEMVYITKSIHQLESKLKLKQNIQIEKELKNIDKEFEKDLMIIKDILGKNYFLDKQMIMIEKTSLNNIENQIKNYIDKNTQNIDTLKDILSQIKHLSYINLYEFISSFSKPIDTIAVKLNKEIYPLKIQGDKNIKISPKYTPLLKSLIHIFNNALDHGIEAPERRVELNKDIRGSVSCNLKTEEKKIIIEISDDGSGIDFNKLIDKAVKKHNISIQTDKQLNQKEKIKLLFMDHLSTKETATTLSGRGIGLSTLKNNIEKFNADIEVYSTKNTGTTFKITIQEEI